MAQYPPLTNRQALPTALAVGGLAGAVFLAGYDVIAILCLALTLGVALRSKNPELVLGLWGGAYIAVTGFWMLASLQNTLLAAFVLIGLFAAGFIGYGAPALTLRYKKTCFLWPIALACAEWGSAALDFSLSPIGLWTLDSALAYPTTLGSIYFSSFIVALIALTAALLFQRPIIPTAIAASAAFLIGAPQLPTAPDLSIASISIGSDADAKWSAENAPKVLANLLDKSTQYAEADLIIWPENAVTTTFDLNQAIKAVSTMQTPLLFGMTRYQDNQTYSLVNSGVLVDGDTVQVSDKIQLAPVAEGGNIPFFKPALQIGDRSILTLASGHKILLLICYEAMLQIPVTDTNDADFIVIISAESGFGKISGARIMRQHVRARALETQKPFIHVSELDPVI